MKKITSLCTLVLLLFAGSLSVQAQEEVPKEVLLTTLNSVNTLGLSNLKTQELMEYNSGFVDKVYDIIDSDKSDKDKGKALDTLNNSKEKDLLDLLDKKHFKKYVKLMEDQLKPLIKKNKLLKHIV